MSEISEVGAGGSQRKGVFPVVVAGLLCLGFAGVGWWLGRGSSDSTDTSGGENTLVRGDVLAPESDSTATSGGENAADKYTREAFEKVRVPTDLTPEKICAVPGIEFSIYFENLGFQFDPEDMRLAYRFSGSFGRLERRRWVGIPAQSDVGDHLLEIKLTRVFDGKEFDYVIPIAVRPIKAAQRALRILFVGDSITRQIFYPNRVVRLLEENGVDVTTFGNVSFPKNKVAEGQFVNEGTLYRDGSDPGVFVEAYNGWITGWFLQKWFPYAPEVNPESDVSRSPFWWPEAGFVKGSYLPPKSDAEGNPLEKGELSFQKYIDAVGDGIPPDIVILMLGTNDAYCLDPVGNEPIATSQYGTSMENFDALVKLFRETDPRLPIFVVTPPPVPTSESAFHATYGGMIKNGSPLNSKLSMQLLFEAMMKHFAGQESDNIFLIPAFVGMDPIDGYLPSQMVHPSEYGHSQLANQIFAFLVHWMQGEMSGSQPR